MDSESITVHWVFRLAIIAPTVIVTIILVCLLRKFRTKCLGSVPQETEVPRGLEIPRQNQSNNNIDIQEGNENIEGQTEPDNFENQDLRIYRNRRNDILNELPSLFTDTNDVELGGPRLNLEVTIVGSTTTTTSTSERDTEENELENELNLRDSIVSTEQPPPYSSLFYAPPPNYETAIQ